MVQLRFYGDGPDRSVGWNLLRCDEMFIPSGAEGASSVQIIAVNGLPIYRTNSSFGIASLYALYGASYHVLFVVHPVLLGAAAARETNRAALSGRIMAAVLKVANADHGSLVLLNDTGQPHVAATADLTGPLLISSASIAGLSQRHKRPSSSACAADSRSRPAPVRCGVRRCRVRHSACPYCTPGQLSAHSTLKTASLTTLSDRSG